jgi:hypothetical protein
MVDEESGVEGSANVTTLIPSDPTPTGVVP